MIITITVTGETHKKYAMNSEEQIRDSRLRENPVRLTGAFLYISAPFKVRCRFRHTFQHMSPLQFVRTWPSPFVNFCCRRQVLAAFNIASTMAFIFSSRCVSSCHDPGAMEQQRQLNTTHCCSKRNEIIPLDSPHHKKHSNQNVSHISETNAFPLD